jgi:hypothetical protein
MLEFFVPKLNKVESGSKQHSAEVRAIMWLMMMMFSSTLYFMNKSINQPASENLQPTQKHPKM